jgi:peptidoglycan/LPS O-acetylase OafA/YrhL
LEREGGRAAWQAPGAYKQNQPERRSAASLSKPHENTRASSERHRFHVLDGMRGVAAIMVMAFHYFSPLPYLKNAFIAVDFFFILSGFVICHAYGDKLDQGMSFGDFVTRRVGRLYPFLLIGILVGAPFLYLERVNNFNGFTMRDFIVTLVSNILFVPYISTNIAALRGFLFPSDMPLWSIFFELAASLTFPFLSTLSTKQLRLLCLLSVAVLVASSFLRGFSDGGSLFNMNGGWHVDNFLGGFPRVFFGFPCGVLLYRLLVEAQGKNTSVRSFNPWLLYVGLIAILMFPIAAKGVYPLLAIATLAPYLVWCGGFSVCLNGFTTKISQFLGWLSYPLFCLHMPVLAAMTRLDKSTALLSRVEIPPAFASLGVALMVSIFAAILGDKLQWQRRFTHLLRAKTKRTLERLL